MALGDSISADNFARRLKSMTKDEGDEKRYAFFLGAGCSVSSGIPDAATLVKDDWLPRLRGYDAPGRKDLDTWAGEVFAGYEGGRAELFYGPVMDKLFRGDYESRQREIETLCGKCYPYFGYAVLAALMAWKGGCFSVALTTNFDDLIADALYLFAGSRALVIPHESLARFIKGTRTRPLVVKLHGDHQLEPKNTVAETAELEIEMATQIRFLLQDRGLIFLGYGGNDEGVLRMLRALPPSPSALPLGVYWVSGTEPGKAMADWLESREATWVKSGDFDELMVIIKNEFELPHPDGKRFEKLFEKYAEAYETINTRIAGRPDTPEGSALKEAAKRVEESFPDWWAVELAARRVREKEPEQAERIYRKGLKRFPKSAQLLGNYAVFLADVRKRYKRAGELYRRAIDADPQHANNLCNYAVFLQEVPKDYEQAEEMYHRAMKVEPNNANFLGNYAGFLLFKGRRKEGLPLLAKVLGLRDLEEHPGLAAECWFYAFAHRPAGPAYQRLEALRILKRVLVAGDRSPWWDFSQNIERARQEGHPDVEWLEKLAAVINGEADISILDGWEKWRDA